MVFKTFCTFLQWKKVASAWKGLINVIFSAEIEGEMLIITPQTILQIFCEFIFRSEVIFKSIKDPDDNFQRWTADMKGFEQAVPHSLHPLSSIQQLTSAVRVSVEAGFSNPTPSRMDAIIPW